MHDTRPVFKFDNACAISQGGRAYQEDAIVSDFSSGAEVGFTVLSDGMGGHAAGDVASKIVVTEVFSELVFQREKIAQDPTSLGDILPDAVAAANACLKSHMSMYPETRGMGATLVACIVIKDELRWISVGDSPLFLFRDNTLRQLNQDHSLAPHIDLMVQSGEMTAAEGEAHPERNVLTSVLAGQTDVSLIDCPDAPFRLKAGDTLIVASDGLQYLKNDTILQVLRDRPLAPSSDITDALMSKLDDLDDPDLDNVTMSLIQVRGDGKRVLGADAMPQDIRQKVRKELWPFARRGRVENAQESPINGV